MRWNLLRANAFRCSAMLRVGPRLPMVCDDAGEWRRAHPGDGVAEALLALLTTVDESSRLGNFTVRSWTRHGAVGERAVGVDQTNESVIVGDAAVVKWATHLQEGPHPAPHRISVLRDAGFTGMPTPWGMVTWRPPGGDETLVASVDEYVPGAVDGWTWAVDLITEAARERRPDDGHRHHPISRPTDRRDARPPEDDRDQRFCRGCGPVA